MPDNSDEPAEKTPEEADQDSVTFTRCVSCKHSVNVDYSAGTLLCRKHNMRCSAEVGAIPDDCLQFEPDSNHVHP